MRRALLLLLCAPGLLLSFSYASEPLRVTGRVVHGETGRSVRGVEVRVLGMSAGRQPQEQVTHTDAAGRFAVQMDPSLRAYAVQAFYRGVVYTEGPLAPKGNRLEVTVRVYETTRDPRNLVLLRRALLLEPVTRGVLEIREVVVLANRAPRTYVGGEEGTLRLPLPPGAREVSVWQGMSPVGIDASGALVDSLPVPPGLREMIFSYRVPHRAGRISLTLPVTLPVAALDVFAPEPLEIRSPSLPGREARTVQGRRVVRAWGEKIPAGSAVVVEVSGLAAPSRTLPGLVVGFLVLIGVSAAARPWMRRTPVRT
ncbi:MAG: hypothetical protein QN193_11325 [Armatimonadota bacterium]|nr:hypothetical protein [Armatimonadota bacterium]MDR7444739.1 hypothetical protein [Armatimonadota bacterium]MDR7571186.1 hypothetical protein [Armatimonadota bacterium]MDR7613257.1 hypothetical protein [Armatimonadota bacterium]